MYGVEQFFTSPYSILHTQGNAFCKQFDHMLFSLLKTLKAEEKTNWLAHLPALVFEYNATAHASTGYQQYQLMFECCVPALCDSCLGLWEYNDNKSVTRIDWVSQQLEQLLCTNKCL